MDEPERPSAISWFEIPVEDVDRAVAFYSAVLGCEFTVDDETGDTYPMFTGPNGATYAIIDDPAGNRVGLMADG